MPMAPETMTCYTYLIGPRFASFCRPCFLRRAAVRLRGRSSFICSIAGGISVVQWAAMDFLREAMQRNRRILQLRDIVLLILRTAAVAAVRRGAVPSLSSRGEQRRWQWPWLICSACGARPVRRSSPRPSGPISGLRLLGRRRAILFGSLAGFLGLDAIEPGPPPGPEVASTTQPVHAILGRRQQPEHGLPGARRHAARRGQGARRRNFVDKLPTGSRMIGHPLCGQATASASIPYRTPGDANQAIDRVRSSIAPPTCGRRQPGEEGERSLRPTWTSRSS